MACKLLAALTFGCLLAGAPWAWAQEHTLAPDDLKWGPTSPALPPGAQVAILTGDPAKEGLYVIRLKLPAGYKVPAHTHPHDEHVTDKLDEAKAKALKAGGYAHAAKDMQHFAFVTDETVIQVHGMGPQGITYVNPADDPRNKKSN
jgi:hypothetical protein